MFSKKIVILIFILFSVLAVFAVVFLNDEYSASARRAAFEADRTRYMSDILRITDGVAPVLWIEPKYSYENNGKYFDLSGNANHATQSTADYQPAVNPPGLEFDGVDDYVDGGSDSSLNPVSEITIESWIKISEGVNPDYQYFITKDSSDVWTSQVGYQLFYYVGTLRMRIHNSSSMQSYNAGTISYNTWQHIAATYDGQNIKLYINGSIVGTSGSITGNISNSTENLYIGTTHHVDKRWINGSIDEVRIYNIALTAAQIQNLYLAGLPGHR